MYSETSMRKNEQLSEGIVIYYDASLLKDIRAVVLDLDALNETKKTVLRRISRTAFELAENIYYDTCSDKGLQRKMDKPLIFGQIISWSEAHVDIRGSINRFERIPSLYESRERNGFGQILLEGAVNPDRKEEFYTALLGYIPLTGNVIHEPASDVYLKAWISLLIDLNTDNEYTFSAQFDSFDSVCSSGKQLDVAILPWNNGSGKYVASTLMPEDDNDDIFLEKECYIEEKKEWDLTGATAYMTGDRALYLIEYPDEKCFLPLRLTSLYWTIGNKYLVDCFWESNTESYYVTNAVSLRQDHWPIDRNSHLLKTEVVGHKSLRGIYFSEKYGVMDDPVEAMALLHLTKFEKESVPVAIIDNFPSRHKQYRFSIEEIIDDDDETYANSIKFLSVTGVIGVVIPDGVFCAEHSPTVFEFSRNENRPPHVGCRVKFDAKYDYYANVFEVVKWTIVQDKTLKVVKCRFKNIKGASKHRQHVYSVKAELVRIFGTVDMLYCDEFGLIDDCLNIVPINMAHKHYNIWVKERMFGERFLYPPRTPFFVVAVGKDYPLYAKTGIKLAKVEKVISESSTPDEGKFLNANNSPIANWPSQASTISTNVSEVSSTADSNIYQKDVGASFNSDDSPPQSYVPIYNDCYYGFKVAPNAVDENGSPLRLLRRFGNSGQQTLDSYIFKSMPPVNEEEIEDHIEENDYEDSDSEDTLSIELGGFDPMRHISFHPKPTEKYTGPVPAAPGTGYKFNVIETFSRLKASIKHGSCGSKCAIDCPWMTQVAFLTLNDEFRKEVEERHKPLYDMILNTLGNVEE